MADKKDITGGAFCFPGNITINGPMFDIHDNEHVENHYHFGSTQAQEPEEDDEDVVDELKPIFYGNRQEAAKFLTRIRGAKPTQVTEAVNELLADGKISNMSCNKRLWEVLNKHGLYDKHLSNWNSQVRAKR